MIVSTSILSIKDNLKENLKKLNRSTTDYIHLDIMDGIFVPNKTGDINNICEITKYLSKPLDVHLMVNDLNTYIINFSKLHPSYITFHAEATTDIQKYIDLIKSYKIKVGLSIKPNTNIEVLIPYLEKIDLVLVMSVEPGYGGQKFIDNSLNKIKYLQEIKIINNYDYVIEVDGGINNETIKLVKEAGADMVVSGSYITNSDDYQKQIEFLHN